jgi:uncharacterized protein (DUF2252 family)
MTNQSAEKSPRRSSKTVLEHPSPAERAARGKSAREAVPREAQADYDPPSTRPDPIGLLEEQAVSRVPELVPIRYGRMLASPFAFFRGGALVMASDLAATARSGLMVQACGDAHLSNFGVFGSPERKLVFDVNDFDETLPGPWEWDLKRLVVSFVVAGRDLGFSKTQRASAVLAGAESYRNEMRTLAEAPNLDVWYSDVDVEKFMAQMGSQLQVQQRKRTEKGLAKARTRDSLQALDKLCKTVDGEPRIVSDPPLVVPISELDPGLGGDAVRDWMHELIRIYRETLQSDRRRLLEQFRFVDLARKVVGVGSVGTRAWIVLLLGRDERDPLFLQAKEAQDSVLARFVAKSHYDNQGERVVAGQHLMQASSDIFLGWQRTEGIDGVKRDFYVRQLRDWKGSVDPDRMVPTGMAAYARLCGGTLARAHARSGDRIAISAYLGKSAAFDRALVTFAEIYADQNERDYQQLQQAVIEGRVVAKTGI